MAEDMMAGIAEARIGVDAGRTQLLGDHVQGLRTRKITPPSLSR